VNDAVGKVYGYNLKTTKFIHYHPVSEDRIYEMDQILLGEDGYLQILPEEVYEQFTQSELAHWAVSMGYWIYPTQELIDAITSIMEFPGLEICAGTGILGRALGIKSIDLKLSKYKFYRDLFRNNNMAEPNYGPWVVEGEAGKTIKDDKPTTVVGSYVISRGGERAPWGINEDILLNCVKQVILIQPGEYLSAAFKRKAKILGIKVFAKKEGAMVYVYENKFPKVCSDKDVESIFTRIAKDQPTHEVEKLLGMNNMNKPSSVMLSSPRTTTKLLR
jgi:hypothetical protein